MRLKRLEAGNFGDCEPVGAGVQALREHLGADYRVYFGRHGKTVVILLCAGSKRVQPADIKAAKAYFSKYVELAETRYGTMVEISQARFQV